MTDHEALKAAILADRENNVIRAYCGDEQQQEYMARRVKIEAAYLSLLAERDALEAALTEIDEQCEAPDDASAGEIWVLAKVRHIARAAIAQPPEGE